MKNYTITVETYVSDQSVEFLSIAFEDEGLTLLGITLSLYGRDLPLVKSIVDDLIYLSSAKTNVIDGDRFWCFVDDGALEDTGYQLGAICVVSNPEFYPSVFYRKESDEVILLPIVQGVGEAFFIRSSEFISMISWWLGVCSFYPKKNDLPIVE